MYLPQCGEIHGMEDIVRVVGDSVYIHRLLKWLALKGNTYRVGLNSVVYHQPARLSDGMKVVNFTPRFINVDCDIYIYILFFYCLTLNTPRFI